MDTSRKANGVDHEITMQYKSRQETLLVEELTEDKLTSPKGDRCLRRFSRWKLC
jgi:hypothetical protein